MAVSAEKRSSRVRRQASKKQRKNRTVQVRFSDEELAALDAVCESTGMTRSAVLRSWTVPGEGAGSNPVYVVTKNAEMPAPSTAATAWAFVRPMSGGTIFWTTGGLATLNETVAPTGHGIPALGDWL